MAVFCYLSFVGGWEDIGLACSLSLLFVCLFDFGVHLDTNNYHEAAECVMVTCFV